MLIENPSSKYIQPLTASSGSQEEGQGVCMQGASWEWVLKWEVTCGGWLLKLWEADWKGGK
jgi:hypothetical protein